MDVRLSISAAKPLLPTIAAPGATARSFSWSITAVHAEKSPDSNPSLKIRSLDTAVAVGGAIVTVAVAVGDIGVAVGETAVAVAVSGNDVAVTVDVAVGGKGVAVGGTAVAVGVGVGVVNVPPTLCKANSSKNSVPEVDRAMPLNGPNRTSSMRRVSLSIAPIVS